MKTILLSLVLAAAAFAQVPGTDVYSRSASLTAASADCTGPAACLTYDLRSVAASAVGIQVSGTFSATLAFEGSIDCANYFSIFATSLNNNGISTATGTTGTGEWVFQSAAGFCSVRVRVSAFTSGAAAVLLRPSAAVPSSFFPVALASFTPADGTASTAASLLTPSGAFSLGTFLFSFNGATWDRARSISASSLAASVNVGALLAEKGPRWSANNNATVAGGVQGTIGKGAGGATVRHVVDCISFSANSSAAVAAANVFLNVRDGATGAGTILWQYSISFPTAGALGVQEVAPTQFCGLALIGTANTVMTIEFSASTAGVIQSVGMTGYDVQ